MSACKVIIGNAAIPTLPRVDSLYEGEKRILEFDLSEEIDCAGVGDKTITQSTWSILAADDDGSLTIDGSAIAGLVTQANVSVAATVEAAKSVRLVNTIESTDGATRTRACIVPVGPVPGLVA